MRPDDADDFSPDRWDAMIFGAAGMLAILCMLAGRDDAACVLTGTMIWSYAIHLLGHGLVHYYHRRHSHATR